ncbi:TPA: DUF1796 family putative cysteine peptidase [Campylobacter jejuni]|nr:hypothetical protein [Campylobacter jejuni]HEC2396243.1 hypothetical protein [Campylobacter jejuni]
MNLQPKKCPLEKIHADVVLSVGTNCRTAHHLGTYNLRKEANPLDWMMCFSLDVVYHLFQNDFKDFFVESLNEGKFNQHNLRVRDLRTNMISIHHFNHKDDLKKQSQEINSRAIKRWLRIKEKITNKKNIVFVYNGGDSIEQITIFLKSINNLFGLEKKVLFHSNKT